jgi:hypothetical protein
MSLFSKAISKSRAIDPPKRKGELNIKSQSLEKRRHNHGKWYTLKLTPIPKPSPSPSPILMRNQQPPPNRPD